MEGTIIELASGQANGVWKNYPCPACQTKKHRPILNIKIDSGVIIYHCFSDKCVLHGHKRIYSEGQSPGQTRAMLLKQKKYDDIHRYYKLPDNYIRSIPKKYLTWLNQYGIDRELIDTYEIGYCHVHKYNGREIFKDRLIIPTPSGFIARSLIDEPKWKNFTNYDFISKNTPKKYNSIVLCEDPISTIKVGQVMPCMALFGTGIRKYHLINVMKYKKVIIWLDGDKAGILGSMKIKKQLDPYISNRIININGKDPKDLDVWDIKERLL